MKIVLVALAVCSGLMIDTPAKEKDKMTEADFHKDLEMIRRLEPTARTSDLVSLIDRLHSKWNREQPQFFGELMIEGLGLLMNRTREDKGISETVTQYAELALKKGDLMSLETNAVLVERFLLTRNQNAARTSAERERLTDVRDAHADAILQVVARIQKGHDPSWDAEDKPEVNVMPPLATGLPAGVSPEAIADPVLRMEYEKAINDNQQKTLRHREQREIRNLEGSFLPWAQKRLARMYADDPTAAEELTRKCDEWGIGSALRDGVLETIQQAAN